ncbi:hypothetical protein CAEBREN_21561 [Caenorhabditis brenneri]|uniref:Uncharacterized protein n=1 Tax=Caenorhabditis brenneri TaxID=135651 RepID=G0ND79_CAEBE|nr:hypothetical protein CAEBREN_21561 [Caenorhabditis brenneri]
MSISTTNDSNLDLEARPSTATEEELQLQIALTLSREKCKKAKEMKKSDDARLQLALEESQKDNFHSLFCSIGYQLIFLVL